MSKLIDDQLTKSKTRRTRIYAEHQNSDETWNQVIMTLGESKEILKDFIKLQALDPFCKFTNEIQIANNNPNTTNALSTLTGLIDEWKRENGKCGVIPNLIGHLIVLDFEDTADKIGAIINNDGNEIHFDLSGPQLNSFYGRKRELETLEKFVAEQDHTKLNLLAITGSFGIGKTVFALHFGIKFQNMFDQNVIWINAESNISITREFTALASELSIPTSERELKIVIDDCYEYFQWTRSLFIFDNVETYSELSHFLPKNIQKPNSLKPFILITSRDNYSWFIKNIPIQSLDALSPEDSFEFLFNELSSVSSESDLVALGLELGYYPQAMRHGIAFIKNIERSNRRMYREIKYNPVQEFILNYRVETEQLSTNLEKDYTIPGENQTISLIASLKLIYPKLLKQFSSSISKIKDKEEEIQFKTLTLISYGAPDYLPKMLLRDLSYGETCDSVIEALLNYSIIFSRDEYFSIHRAVQKAFRLHLLSIKGYENGSKLLESLIEDIDRLIESIKYNVHCFKTMKTFQPTFESMSSFIMEFGIIKEHIQFIRNLWHLYNVLEMHNEAYDFSIRILQGMSEKVNETELCYLKVRACVGVSLIYKYKAMEAIEALQGIYGQCVSKPEIGKTHPFTLEIGIWLAFLLGRISKVSAAESLYNELLELSKGLDDPIHRIRARTGLADIQKCLGKYKDSVENFALSLKDALANLGPQHYETQKLQFLLCIGGLEIEPLLGDAYTTIQPLVQLVVSNLGYKSLLTLKAFILYSKILIKMKQYEQANREIEQILPFAPEIVAVDHPAYLQLMEISYDVKHKLKIIGPNAIVEVQVKNLEVKRKILNYDNTQTSVIESLLKLGNTYYGLGQYYNAKKMFEQAYDSQKQIFGEISPITHRTKVKLEELQSKLENIKLENLLSPPSSQSDEDEDSLNSTKRNIPPLICKDCSKIFKNKKTLQKHVRDRHTRLEGQRPSCPYCQTRLYDNYGVKRHLETCKKKPENEEIGSK